MDSTLRQNRATASLITEEVLSSTIHGLGAVAGIVGLIFGLMNLSGPDYARVGFIVYCVSLVLLMAMSSLYHALIFSKARDVFLILDQSAIFLLIAGSYTPFILYLFSGWQMYAMLSLVWVTAVTGIVIRAALPMLAKRLGTGLYICFGWLAVLFIPQFSHLGLMIGGLIAIGGALYTIGAIIKATQKPFTHFGWHILVVIAATTHYIAIVILI